MNLKFLHCPTLKVNVFCTCIFMMTSSAYPWEVETNSGQLTGTAKSTAIVMSNNSNALQIECTTRSRLARFLILDNSGAFVSAGAELRLVDWNGDVITDKNVVLESWNDKYILVESTESEFIETLLHTMERAKGPIEVGVSVPRYDYNLQDEFSSSGSTKASKDLFPLCMGYTQKQIADGTFEEEFRLTKNLVDAGCKIREINFGRCEEVLQLKGCAIQQALDGGCKK